MPGWSRPRRSSESPSSHLRVVGLDEEAERLVGGAETWMRARRQEEVAVEGSLDGSLEVPRNGPGGTRSR